MRGFQLTVNRGLPNFLKERFVTIWQPVPPRQVPQLPLFPNRPWKQILIWYSNPLGSNPSGTVLHVSSQATPIARHGSPSLHLSPLPSSAQSAPSRHRHPPGTLGHLRYLPLLALAQVHHGCIQLWCCQFCLPHLSFSVFPVSYSIHPSQLPSPETRDSQ